MCRINLFSTDYLGYYERRLKRREESEVAPILPGPKTGTVSCSNCAMVALTTDVEMPTSPSRMLLVDLDSISRPIRKSPRVAKRLPLHRI